MRRTHSYLLYPVRIPCGGPTGRASDSEPQPNLKVGTHITAPRPTRESADCWPSHGETIAAQYLTCKFRHVRTDTRPSWPHRGRTVTDSSGLNFDGHAASAMDVEKLIEEIRKFPVVYDQSNDKYRNTEYKEKVWKKIADNLELGEAYGQVWPRGNRAEPAPKLGRLTCRARCGYVCPNLKTLSRQKQFVSCCVT
ncbi:hypothetical protein J6590_076820 [Homalodisca vitripennis]|nr:hypothetical protein J6590_076820 [Homalodisca vitripennis]